MVRAVAFGICWGPIPFTVPARTVRRGKLGKVAHDPVAAAFNDPPPAPPELTHGFLSVDHPTAGETSLEVNAKAPPVPSLACRARHYFGDENATTPAFATFLNRAAGTTRRNLRAAAHSCSRSSRSR